MKEVVKDVTVSVVKENNEEVTKEMAQKIQDEISQATNKIQAEIAQMKNITNFVKTTGMSGHSLEVVGNSVKEMIKPGTLAEDVETIDLSGIQKAQITTGNAAQLVFSEMHRGILGIAETYGTFLRDASVFNTTQNTYSIVFENALGDNGAFVDEAADATLAAMTFSKKEVTCKKWVKFVGLSEEVLEDSEPEDIGAFVIRRLGIAYGLFVDKIGFDKVVSNTTAGKVVSSASGGKFTPTFDELVNTVAMVKASVLPGSAWYMHRTVWANIMKLKDGNSRPLIEINNSLIIQPGRDSGIGPVGNLLGYPIYTVDAMVSTEAVDKKYIVFGNLQESACAIVRRGYQIEQDKKLESGIHRIKGSTRVQVENLLDALAFVQSSAS